MPERGKMRHGDVDGASAGCNTWCRMLTAAAAASAVQAVHRASPACSASCTACKIAVPPAVLLHCLRYCKTGDQVCVMHLRGSQHTVHFMRVPCTLHTLFFKRGGGAGEGRCHSAQEAVPHAVPQPVPQAVLHAGPPAVPRAVPQAVPHAVPRAVPQAVPHAVLRAINCIKPASSHCQDFRELGLAVRTPAGLMV
eukprot:228388-Chlamydomonas_euryale.AAC.2